MVKFRSVLILLTIQLLLHGCNFSRDHNDAKVVADRIYTHIRAGNYAAIYNDAAPRFKKVGSESQFVEKMKRYESLVGPLKNIHEIASQAGFDTEAGSIFIIVYDVQFERARAREEMTFIRSPTGEMQ